MARGDELAIRVIGDDEIRKLFEMLESSVDVKIMLRYFRAASKPIQQAMDHSAQNKLNKKMETTHFKRGSSVHTAFPLTIARNIKVITGKNKDFPNIVVGVKYKKKGFSGSSVDDPFFANWVGLGGVNRGKTGTIPFMVNDWSEAGVRKIPIVRQDINTKLYKYLNKKVKQKGYKLT